MQREPSLYPDKETFLEREKKTTTSSEESSFIQKGSLQHPSEEFPPNTKDTKRCLAKKSRKGYPDILFGITPSNYFRELPLRYLDDYSPLPRAKLPKHKSSWPNT